MALNSVMLEEGTRHPVPQLGENFLYHCSGVKLELKSGDGYRGEAVAVRCGSGTAFVSNQRIVYLAATATDTSSIQSSAAGTLNSFTAPHTALRDQRYTQPLFGANRFEALVLRTPGSGLAGPVALTLSFKDGGGFDFATVARKMAERIRDTGAAPPCEEELPVYDGAPPQDPAPPEYRPDDAPPGYDQLSMRR
ncbi:hypothetical protein H4R18_004648 [Coemansia javaensis]|uniref:Uncharacterized protein n=1 Tax=Coemansia javaensis TaxID=2761396 RepID=A0A9W8LGS4_9FUNG|nr:hypothetical protein H4R18_004648 [Coemansia javaensis]